MDFLLTVKGKPLKIPFVYQVVLDGGRDLVEAAVRCLPAADFLAGLV